MPSDGQPLFIPLVPRLQVWLHQALQRARTGTSITNPSAWRFPCHAPRGVMGRLILIMTVHSLPGPAQAVPLARTRVWPPRTEPTEPTGLLRPQRKPLGSCWALQHLGLLLPLRRGNKMGTVMQHAQATPERLCLPWSCCAGIKQTRQACSQLTAKK